jgi:glycerol-3-phosphate dehydrogenase
LSRGHTIEIDESHLLTITGGKWTTYRQMAEDAVDQAILIAQLPRSTSTTADLKIIGPASSETSFVGQKLHPDLPYDESDVNRAVRDEYALTLEDVLARRTRALFLNAKVAIEIAPKVAELMAVELGKDQEWITEQLDAFEQTAKNYLVHSDVVTNRES